jgi:hypothetical protein
MPAVHTSALGNGKFGLRSFSAVEKSVILIFSSLEMPTKTNHKFTKTKI